MSCQKVTSVRQTALLLSTKLQYEAVIQVQARARIPEIRSISDLHTEHIVPKIVGFWMIARHLLFSNHLPREIMVMFSTSRPSNSLSRTFPSQTSN